ncbi:MAG: hypothetical protein ACRDOK_01240 [Streptosporangiaceae bacterium]
MSEQALDLRRSAEIVRRRWMWVGIMAALGLLAGIAYSELRPPLVSSTALVVMALPTNEAIATQRVIADSEPVLSGAVHSLGAKTSVQAFSSHINVRSLAPDVLSVTAQGKTAADAERASNAVAQSYVSYVARNSSVTGVINARLLSAATNASGTSLRSRLTFPIIGALLGAAIGAIGALARGRRDRRLRLRDDIAHAIGVPVIASLPVWHPKDAAGWADLLKNYEPTSTQAWRLGRALDYLGLSDITSGRAVDGRRYLVTVLSLSSDHRALALGPQLAVFSASRGVPTALIVQSQPEPRPAAALLAACAATQSASRTESRLRIAVDDGHERLPAAALTIVVAVADTRNPQIVNGPRSHATLLGISAGTVTAEQVASLAGVAAAGGREIKGILVADPDPADRTTGSIPQLAQPIRLRPTRMTGVTREPRPAHNQDQTGLGQ